MKKKKKGNSFSTQRYYVGVWAASVENENHKKQIIFHRFAKSNTYIYIHIYILMTVTILSIVHDNNNNNYIYEMQGEKYGKKLTETTERRVRYSNIRLRFPVKIARHAKDEKRVYNFSTIRFFVLNVQKKKSVMIIILNSESDFWRPFLDNVAARLMIETVPHSEIYTKNDGQYFQ